MNKGEKLLDNVKYKSNITFVSSLGISRSFLAAHKGKGEI